MRSVLALRHGHWLVAGALVLLSGCGGSSKGVKLEGKLVKDGQPLKVGQGEIVSLSFSGGADGKASTVGASVSDDGTFVVNNIPPGKYKLRVGLTSGGNTPAEMKKTETLNKQFDAANTKLEYEVTGDAGQKIDVDVGKGTVAKQS